MLPNIFISIENLTSFGRSSTPENSTVKPHEIYDSLEIGGFTEDEAFSLIDTKTNSETTL